jgi:K+ transporter
MLSTSCSKQALEAELSSSRVPRLPGTCVIVTSNPDPRYAIARCFEWMRRCGCLREKVILLSLVGTAESHITMEERLEVTALDCSLWHVIAYHGYMQDSNAPKILIGCAIQNNDTFFVLPRR